MLDPQMPILTLFILVTMKGLLFVIINQYQLLYETRLQYLTHNKSSIYSFLIKKYQIAHQNQINLAQQCIAVYYCSQIKENINSTQLSSNLFLIMKKMKYLLLKTHKQKSKLHSKDHQSQYLNTMKHEAIKSLQDFQQNCLNQTQLKITLTSDRPNSQYRSKSDQKQNMRKTYLSIQSSAKHSNINQQTIFQANSLNIRKLLRIKTQVQQKEATKLKNPFYKIQKARELPKKFSMIQKRQEISIKQNNSLSLKNQKPPKSTEQKENDCFISRQKKQWYFASRKFRSRTFQQDQSAPVNKKRQESETKMPQSLLASKDNLKREDPFYPKIHERHLSSFAQFESIGDLNMREQPKVRYNDENESIKQNETENNSKLRQRSLTVKYNEIKDYFERKYNKSNLNEYQNENSQGYQEQSHQL